MLDKEVKNLKFMSAISSAGEIEIENSIVAHYAVDNIIRNSALAG